MKAVIYTLTLLSETITSRPRLVGMTGALGLFLLLGAGIAAPVASFPPIVVAGFLSFGLMALLYLVTEAVGRSSRDARMPACQRHVLRWVSACC